MAKIGFDATNVAPMQNFDPIPAGDYVAVITDSDIKQTRAGTGHYLALTFEVTEGPAKGRKVWANLNLQNPNPKAVEIAQRELSAICHAVGALKVQDSQELHYKPMTIRVDIEARDGYSPSNSIKAYKPANAAVGAAPFAQAPQSPAHPSDSVPPWQR